MNPLSSRVRRESLHLLFLTMEVEVVRRLLAGNDARCFTTAQYGDAVDDWIAERVGATRGTLGVPAPPIETRRAQLVASTLVVEVAPDVWALKGEVDGGAA